MRRTCLRAAVPGSVVRLSVELQTPGLPEGQEEGRLAFSLRPPSALPFAFYSTSLSFFLSLTFTHSFSVSALLELGENSCCTACAQASHLTSPAYPINHGTLLTAVCTDPSALDREKLRTLWVSDFETIYPEGPRPPYQLIMFHKLQQYITDHPQQLLITQEQAKAYPLSEPMGQIIHITQRTIPVYYIFVLRWKCLPSFLLVMIKMYTHQSKCRDLGTRLDPYCTMKSDKASSQMIRQVANKLNHCILS